MSPSFAGAHAAGGRQRRRAVVAFVVLALAAAGLAATVRLGQPQAHAEVIGSTLWPGMQLLPGQSIYSPNGQFGLSNTGYEVRTYGSGQFLRTSFSIRAPRGNFNAGVLAMQPDGDIVFKVPASCDQPDVGKICNPRDQVYWSSGTGGNPGTRLVMEDNGTLNLKTQDDSVVWSVPW